MKKLWLIGIQVLLIGFILAVSIPSFSDKPASKETDAKDTPKSTSDEFKDPEKDKPKVVDLSKDDGYHCTYQPVEDKTSKDPNGKQNGTPKVKKNPRLDINGKPIENDDPYYDEEEIFDNILFLLRPPVPVDITKERSKQFFNDYEEYLGEEARALMDVEETQREMDDAKRKEIEHLEELSNKLIHEYNSMLPDIKPEVPEEDSKTKDAKDQETLERMEPLYPERTDARFFKREDRPTPDDFIEAIRSGDPVPLKTMYYEEMVTVIQKLKDSVADFQEGSRFRNPIVIALMQDSMSNVIRNKIILGLSGGLANLDPRVRLITIRFLRRMIPDEQMNGLIQKFYKLETSGKDVKIEVPRMSVRRKEGFRLKEELFEGDQYQFTDLSGSELNAKAYQQLVRLTKFIERTRYMDRIHKGEFTLIKNMTLQEFALIAEPIDEEIFCCVPINHFTKNEIPALLVGMSHKDKSVGDRCAEALIRIMRTESLSLWERERIFKDLKNSLFQSKIITSKNPEEIKYVNDREAVTLFIDKNGLVSACEYVDDDRYDTRTGEQYIAPDMSYKPIVLGTDLTVTIPPKPSTSAASPSSTVSASRPSTATATATTSNTTGATTNPTRNSAPANRP